MTGVETTNDKNKYKIRIMGEELTVTGSFSEEYIKQLTEQINKIKVEITQAYPRLPLRRLSALIMLNLADDYYKLQQKYNANAQERERLKTANKSLHQELKKLRQENEEVLHLLEEVD